MKLPEKKLSDAELDVMLAIWQNRPPVLRSDLEEQLKSHNWADTTTLTLLSKLVEKGTFRWNGREDATSTPRWSVNGTTAAGPAAAFWGRCTSPPSAAWWHPWWKAGT